MIFDIIILIFIALAGYAGYKKGLVGILVSFIGLILSIILAFMLQGAIADMLYSSGLGNTIEQSIEKSINENLEKNTEEESNSFYTGIIKNIAGEEEITNTSTQVTKFILKGISFVAIFIIVFIICYIIQMMLNIVFDLPILSQINSLGGIGLGVVKALIKVWILLAILSFLAPLPMFNSINAMVKDSILTSFLYDHNLFVSLIKAGLNI